MKILIIGAGNSGLAMAVHLKTLGYSINLWNRSRKTIDKLITHPIITSSGVINGDYHIDLVTDDIEEAIKDVDSIMVTTPASSHKDIAELLGKNMTISVPIILNPGRTFGAIEFHLTYKRFSSLAVYVAETQTILYTCRKLSNESVNIISLKKDVLIAAYKCELINDILNKIPKEIVTFFKPSTNIIETSLGNVGMILHCAPILLNTGWIENCSTVFKYYYDGITPSISRLIEKIDHERIEVARLLNTNIESTKEWMKRTYNLECDSLFDCIQMNDAYKTIDAPKSLEHRYIFEDVPCGLVPLESIGLSMGLKMQATKTIIDLACLTMDIDFRENGRTIMISDFLKSKEE